MTEKLSIDSKIDWESLPREEAIDLAMNLFNFDRAYAQFYVAIAKGEIKGDIFELVEPPKKCF